MVLLSFIPLKCWMAPDTPTAMYKFGATTLPVCPTCKSFAAMPASTAARLAPIAPPPRASANSSNKWNWSLCPIPRPPVTTMSADDKSGRSCLSELELDAWTKVLFSNGFTSTDSTGTLAALVNEVFSNAVGRILNTFIVSVICTLINTFPAYMGRTNVSELNICTTSWRGLLVSNAAARGSTVDPNLVEVARIWVISVSACTAACIAAATVSGRTVPSSFEKGTCTIFVVPNGTSWGMVVPPTISSVILSFCNWFAAVIAWHVPGAIVAGDDDDGSANTNVVAHRRSWFWRLFVMWWCWPMQIVVGVTTKLPVEVRRECRITAVNVERNILFQLGFLYSYESYR